MGLQEREIWEYDQRIIVQEWEMVALPVLLALLFVISFVIIQKKKKENPVYKFYMKGLMAKLFGSLIFCFKICF